MQVKEAVQKASAYLPDVFSSAAGKTLRLEGVEKTDDGKYWMVTFSYSSESGVLGEISRDYKTVKITSNNGEFVGARNGLLLGAL